MCECPGYIDVHANICEACQSWRRKYGYPLDVPCTERIGVVPRRLGRALCHHCNEERMEVARRTQTPPLAQTPPLQPPPAPWQPALPAGAAAAAAIADATAVGGTSQSSRGSLQQLMPATADATPQLHQICARLDALEEIWGEWKR